MAESDNLRQYCRNCTDAQLENVLRDETRRARNWKGSPMGDTARLFAAEARAEIARRSARQSA